MFTRKLGVRLAVCLSAAVPWTVSAQVNLTDFSRPYLSAYGVAPLEVFAADRDVLQLFAGGEVEHRSNVFALPDGARPPAAYGSSSRADTIWRGLVGISFDRQASRQRFRVDAYALPVKFTEYSDFDNVGYSLGGHWDWAVGRPWFGTLGARLTSTLTPFETYAGTRKNLERRGRFYASGGIRLTPSWSAFVGVDSETLENSFSGVEASDYIFTSAETGLRFAPGTGTEVDLVWRYTDGEYPNRQLVDELGNLLPGAVDNKFTQNALLSRLQVRPSDDSRIAGWIGFTSRKFETLSQRDFSGITSGLNLEWMPTGLFTMRVELVRDIQSEELLTASYVDLTSIRLRPSFRLTGKITLFGQAVATRANYEGDPGFVTGTSPRKDDIRILGVGLGYELARDMTVNFEARQTNRDSNYAVYDYSDTMLLANILARF